MRCFATLGCTTKRWDLSHFFSCSWSLLQLLPPLRSPPGLALVDQAGADQGLHDADAPVVAAVSLGQTEGQRSVGVAFANLTTRQLGACEFADDEQFCSLEAVLLQLAAKEVVVALVRFAQGLPKAGFWRLHLRGVACPALQRGSAELFPSM